MIVALEKALSSFIIGTYGSRKSCLEEVLAERKLSFRSIHGPEDITREFDIVFGSGIYSIIREPYLSAPKYGMVFFHETMLPEGRGNAPLQWTVLNCKQNLTVTAFQAAEGMDEGPYIIQQNIGISKLDTLAVLEAKRIVGIKSCLNSILDEMEQGYLVLRGQTGAPSLQRKRISKDSEIDPSLSLVDLWDHIRICDNDKYPAFFRLHGHKVILRYEVLPDNP